MKIGIVGAGRIGGNLASLWAKQQNEVMLSYSRDPANLEQAASAIGARASVGSVREAVEFGDVILFSSLTVHCALPNITADQLRVAFGIAGQQLGAGKSPREIEEDACDLGQRAAVDDECRHFPFRIEREIGRRAHVFFGEG